MVEKLIKRDLKKLLNQEKTEIEFLWLPMTLKGVTKWLRKVTIRYKMSTMMVQTSYGGSWREYWKPVEFINGA